MDAGALIILDGCTFFCSGADGDADAQEAEGFFFEDVRHLSRWRLRVDGQPLDILTSRRVDYFSARVVGTRAAEDGPAPRLAVHRDRFVSEGTHEDVRVENLTEEPVEARVELEFAADFADVMEAQEGPNGAGRTWAEARARSVVLWHDRDGYRRGTAVTFNRRGRLEQNRAVYDLRLRPRETWSLCIDVTPIVDGRRSPPLLRCDSFHEHAPKMPLSLDEWLESAPTLDAEPEPLERTYRQSLLDLAALRVRPDELTIKWPMPGGGLPWFMTIFGRDSLVTAYSLLPFHAEPVRATLEALAELQATEWDNWRDAEPGKIAHELRRGILAATGKIPHTPYYGTHDATLLWLIVLEEYERWTADTAFVRRLEPNVRAAVEWLRGPADLDGDGFLEYRKRSSSEKALDNHCWKDSDDSIRFADGRRAEPPIATCEIQGYAYDARLRAARLLREIYGDEEAAVRLEREAAELRARFDGAFWMPSRGHHALALDGEKRQVDVLASNIGHLLWSGIVDERRARSIVRLLVRDDLFSGWGIRSLSSRETAYNPLAYHNGSVWPHDTALIVAGMRRYGFDQEAARVGLALLEAAEAFTNQLPEVFGGFTRDATRMPVEYPGALKPQSWAAGAPLLVLRTLLGLDVVGGRLRARPCVPPELGRVRLRGLQVRGKRVDV